MRPAEKKGNKVVVDGGTAIIIVPDSILENPSNKPIRDYLVERCDIHAIIGLPPYTFSPYAMEKTYILVFQKRAPENFGYEYKIEHETFFYNSLCDGKANSQNRYPTDHIERVKVTSGQHKREVHMFVHNDFEPCFDSFTYKNYTYRSKIEWAWDRSFSNRNKKWDQVLVSEVWSKDRWTRFPGKKWGFFPIRRVKRQILKEIKTKGLISKINKFIDNNSIEKKNILSDYKGFKKMVLEEIKLSASEREKLEESTDIIIDLKDDGSRNITLTVVEVFNDVEMSPESTHYLGVKREKIPIENLIDEIKKQKITEKEDLINFFRNDFKSKKFKPVRLGSEFIVLQGTQFSKRDAYRFPGNVAVFTAATDGPAYHVGEDIPGKVKVKGPSLIWSRKGAKAGTIQKYDELDSSNDFKEFYISDVSGTIKPHEHLLNDYDFDFLMFYLAGQVKKELQSTANNAQLNKSKLENLEIYLPSTSEQKVIGDYIRKNIL